MERLYQQHVEFVSIHREDSDDDEKDEKISLC